MKVTTVLLLVTLLATMAYAETDGQYNTVLSWNRPSLSGRLIHRSIAFADLREDEQMLGRQITPRLSSFVSATQDSQGNQRIGPAFQIDRKIGGWNLSTTIRLYAGLEGAANRTKTAVYLTHPFKDGWSCGFYFLDNKMKGSPDRYQEYGPIICRDMPHVSTTLYLMGKNTGHQGIQLDFCFAL